MHAILGCLDRTTHQFGCCGLPPLRLHKPGNSDARSVPVSPRKVVNFVNTVNRRNRSLDRGREAGTVADVETHNGGTDVSVDDLEREFCRIPEVTAARVVADLDGRISEV